MNITFFGQSYNYNFNSESSSASGWSSEDQVALFIILGLIFSFVFLYALPQIIMTWKLLKKAGHPGWVALVPVYREWIECKIAKAPEWLFYALVIVGYGIAMLPYVGMLTIPISFGLFIYLIALFSKQYDRPASFWVLYVLLPCIALFMVAKAKYIGELPSNNQPSSSAAAPQIQGSQANAGQGIHSPQIPTQTPKEDNHAANK